MTKDFDAKLSVFYPAKHLTSSIKVSDKIEGKFLAKMYFHNVMFLPFLVNKTANV